MAPTLPLRRESRGGGLTCFRARWPFQIYRSGLPGPGWMGPVQPSKLLFLFMILFPLQENCWACCFDLAGWFSMGLATCNERSWEIPMYFAMTVQK